MVWRSTIFILLRGPNRFTTVKAGSWISYVAGDKKEINESTFANYGDEHLSTQ